MPRQASEDRPKGYGKEKNGSRCLFKRKKKRDADTRGAASVMVTQKGEKGLPLLAGDRIGASLPGKTDRLVRKEKKGDQAE